MCYHASIAALVGLLVVTAPAPPARAAQAACEECLPFAERLKDAQERHADAQARFKAAQEGLTDLESTQTNHQNEADALRGSARQSDQTRLAVLNTLMAATAAAIRLQTARVEAVRTELLSLAAEVQRAARELSDCNARCEKKPSQPPKPPPPRGREVDESMPRAACQACQPIVDRIMQLQAERRAVNDRIDELKVAEAAHMARMDRFVQEVREFERGVRPPPPAPFDDGQWFAEGMRIGLDLNEATRERDRLTREVRSAIDQLSECNAACNQKRTSSLFDRPPVYVAAGAVAVGGLLIARGDGPPGTSVSPTPIAADTPQPSPPTQPSCGAIAGTYSFTGTLRTPRSCFFGPVPTFGSPITGSLIMQVDASCAAVVTVRHPNTWTFVHPAVVTIDASSFRARSSAPFMNTQPFGVQFSSTIDVTVSGSSLSGTETHTSSGCTDVYDLRGNR